MTFAIPVAASKLKVNLKSIFSEILCLCVGLLLITSSAANADDLSSVEYFITQSWSQQQSVARPYYVNVPSNSSNQKLPVFIFPIFSCTAMAVVLRSP